jgi:hypothetical protein
MSEILFWMETSALGQLMRDSVWMFPLAEILHFIGLSLLIGSLLVVDLRLLGVIKNMSYEAVYRFLPISLVGFGINMTTGVLFLFTDPFRYYPNIAFRMKILFILLAGLNALWFKFSVYPLTMKNPETNDSGNLAKVVAGLSLLFWFGVIVLGRMIPYVED